jgi:dephospho-CoA kinase
MFDINKKPLRVGITGGIGSGKTTICHLFESLGIPVYYADDRAKWLLGHDPELIQAVKDLLGEEAYVDGQYNRAYVASVVFNNPELLARLNAISHPAVESDSRKWHESFTNVPYTLKEAALMVESGSHKYLDYLIVVTAPEALRIERVVRRDGVDAASVRSRIARQLAEDEKIALADWVIVNDGQQTLIPQVWKIHQMLNK